MKNILRWVTAGLVFAICHSASTLAENPSHSDSSLQWTMSTPFPEPRTDYAAGVVNNRLVIAGGTYWEGSKGNWIQKHVSSSTHAFDPISHTWAKLSDLPTPLSDAASAVIANKLYVVGGYTGAHINRDIYVLESGSKGNIWKRFGEFPMDRLFAHSVSVGTRLYVLGGITEFESIDAKGTCCTSRTATDSVVMFDTAHPERGWKPLSALPGPKRVFFSAVTDGESIWVFGGSYQSNPAEASVSFNQVFRYHVGENRWEAVKALPDHSPETDSPSPVVVKDKIILITRAKNVWQLDTKSQSYTNLSPLPESAGVDEFVWLNDEIIGAGGENQIEGPRRRSEWTFIGRFLTQ